jgi:hypothetical protein
MSLLFFRNLTLGTFHVEQRSVLKIEIMLLVSISVGFHAMLCGRAGSNPNKMSKFRIVALQGDN